MKDRISQNPGRVLITPENGSAPYYATMTRADNPLVEGDAINKANLLTDETAAQLGLTDAAVVNDALNKLSNATMYWWKRRTEEKGEYPIEQTSSVAEHIFEIVGSTSYGVTTTLIYADSYIFENGIYTLVNPTELPIDMNTVSGSSKTLRGKYFKEKYASKFDTEMWYGTDALSIMRVQDGSYYRATMKNAIRYGVSQQYYENFGAWEYVSATKYGAFPNNGTQDGYKYYYLGIPLNNARDEDSNPRTRVSGSYVGNGEDSVERVMALSSSSNTSGQVLSIFTGGAVQIFVTYGGAFIFRATVPGEFYAIPPEQANFRFGKLTLKTNSVYLNNAGSTYFYRVL